MSLAEPTTAKAASTTAKRRTRDQFRSARAPGMRSPPRTLLTSLPLLQWTVGDDGAHCDLGTVASEISYPRSRRRIRTMSWKVSSCCHSRESSFGGPSSEPFRALAATKNLAQRVRAAPLPVLLALFTQANAACVRRAALRASWRTPGRLDACGHGFEDGPSPSANQRRKVLNQCLSALGGPAVFAPCAPEATATTKRGGHGLGEWLASRAGYGVRARGHLVSRPRRTVSTDARVCAVSASARLPHALEPEQPAPTFKTVRELANREPQTRTGSRIPGPTRHVAQS